MSAAAPARTGHNVSIADLLAIGDEMRVQNPAILQTRGKRPRYFIRPYIERLEDGHIVRVQERIYLSATSKREAIVERNRYMEQINRRQVVLQSQINFGDFLDHFLKERVRRADVLAASTRAKYESHIENHIRPAFGHLAFAEVDTRRIDAMLQQKTRDGMAHATRMDLRNLLCAIFTQAARWGHCCDRNPAKYATVGRPGISRERRKLTVDETRLLLTELPADVSLIAITALTCALRISEVMGLQWKHVDLKQGLLLIRQRYYRGDLDTVKTSNAKRNVQPGTWLMGHLAAMAGDPDEFVFRVSTHRGKRATRDERDINQHFLRPTAKRLGIYYRGFGWHALRHEAITNLQEWMGGMEVARMAGHGRPSMTMEYTRENISRHGAAVEALEHRLVTGRVM